MRRQVPASPEGSWEEYFAAAATKPVHPLYAELDKHLGALGEAVELGCGIGNGVVHLARLGWKVLAVDALPEPLAELRSKLDSDLASRIEIRQAFLEDIELPEAGFDLVVAGFSLFFVSPEESPGVWERIIRSLRPGGLFMGQFLGPNDSWATKGFSLHTEDQVRKLLDGFSILHWEHVERDGKSVHGYPKHWDVTHVIARKT